MLSAKQGSHWYYFYNVFGMTRPGIDPTPIWAIAASYYDRENGKFYHVEAFILTLFVLPAMFTARRYVLSAQTIRDSLRRNNNSIRASRLYKDQIMTRHHRLARVHGPYVISSGGVPTGTGFCSVTNPDFKLVIPMTELRFIAAQTSVMQQTESARTLTIRINYNSTIALEQSVINYLGI